MKIFVTGGTGFVGSQLVREFAQLGYELIVLSRSGRSTEAMPEGASLLQGDPTQPGAWQEKMADCEIIFNLAGSSIFTPWTKKAKQTIRDSRVLTTRHLVDALALREGRNTLLISTSAVGYYGSRNDDEILDEQSLPGEDFLAEIGKEWEAEAKRAENFGARVAICRFGIVLGKGGGALSKMLPAFKAGLGGALGSGKQWFAWIHQDDLVRIFKFVIENERLAGPINCTAPFPARNKDVGQALARALGRPYIMPAMPGFILRAVLGEFAGVVLKGQRVVPNKLLSEGFEFRFPTILEAFQDLVQ